MCRDRIAHILLAVVVAGVLASGAQAQQTTPESPEEKLRREHDEKEKGLDRHYYETIQTYFCPINERMTLKAEKVCADATMLVEECRDKLQDGESNNKDVVSAKELDVLRAESRGLLDQMVRSLPLPGLTGAVPDLLPGITGAFIQPALNALEDPHTLGGVLNARSNPSSLSTELDYVTIGFGGFLAPKPRINPVLKARLLDTQRGDVIQDLEDDSKPWDDVVYQVQVTPTWNWIGRNFKWFDGLYGQLWAQIAKGEMSLNVVPPEEPRTASKAGQRFSRRPVSDPGMRKVAVCMAAEFLKFENEIRIRARDSRISEFYRLVHNQPQLVYTRKELRRSDPIGANESSNRITFASGLFNSVAFLRLAGECSDGLEGIHCPVRYKNMLQSFSTRHSLGIALFYEWGNLATFRYDIPPAAGAFPASPIPLIPPSPVLADSDSVVVEGGRYVRRGASIGLTLQDPNPKEVVKKSSRIDLAWEDVHYDNQQFRADLWVSRLTYTYRLGVVSIPLHLIYRSGTEFKVDVLDRVGAGLGVGLAW